MKSFSRDSKNFAKIEPIDRPFINSIPLPKPMLDPVRSHFLIGIPGSGKSTLAKPLAEIDNAEILSTDRVREELFGDESIQGNWSDIESTLLTRCKNAIAAGRSVVYDATNSRRAWRMDWLQKLDWRLFGSPQQVQWIAWHLTTPEPTCKTWNQQRHRQVPDSAIENMAARLHRFPPLPAEGFATVVNVDPTREAIDRAALQAKLDRARRSQTNRANRTRHHNVRLHEYSRLLDFDRLLHLLSLIIRYPGLGNLQRDSPWLLDKVLDAPPQFESAMDEICAVVARQCGDLYADGDALARDLAWLQRNGFIGEGTVGDPGDLTQLDVKIRRDRDCIPHSYSDLDPFVRLMAVVRFILHHPFVRYPDSGHLDSLVAALQERNIVAGEVASQIRKDIEKVLKPYQILPEFPMRHGYFAGTAILSKRDLKRVFGVLQAQAKSLHDPEALAAYELFEQRMARGKLGDSQGYPVRAIAHQSMVDVESLDDSVLSNHLEEIEEAIETGRLLEFGRRPQSARFPGDCQGRFAARSLQLVFHRSAWYLGLELEPEGTAPGLLRFERLDRLYILRRSDNRRGLEAQARSLQRLQRLHEASPGLFLGTSAADQQCYLSGNRQEKARVEVTVELRFDDEMFRFISEGTRRFPRTQMKMSPPVSGVGKPRSLFSLSRARDREFPHRLRVRLPRWSLEDVDFLRWIVGFGGRVKVAKPPELMARVVEKGRGLVTVNGGGG